MHKLFILFSVFILFGCSDRKIDEVAKEFNFYLSENKTACAFIFYDVEGTPALTIEDRIVSYHFNDENILTTSSPPDFGWKSKETSGFKPFNYYNGDGSFITNEEDKPMLYTSATTVDGVERHYTLLHFNDQEECFSDDSFEDNDITLDLVRKIYGTNE